MSATAALDEKKIALTPKEVSNVLGIAKSNVYVLIQRGELPAIRITARRIIVPKDTLVKYINERAEAAATAATVKRRKW